MEVGKTRPIPFEKAINFGKSSGGKQEESHLGKLDTFNGISRKNYFAKCIEEKSFSSYQTITRSEFRRRKSTFEQLSRSDEFLARKPEKSSEKSISRFLSQTFPGPEEEFEIRETAMTKKLEEIHQIVQKMQDMTGNPEKPSKKTTATLQDGRRKSTTARPRLETNCKLRMKLIPTHFSSSFTTELGSARKTFAEEIIFQTRFVLDLCEESVGGGQEKGRIFRSTVRAMCRPETVIQLNKPFVFR